MRPAENIEKFIKNAPVNTSAKRDEEVLEDVLNALEKSNNLQSVAYLPNLWRITMKSQITKLATAAVVILVVIVGIIELGKPAGGASAVFAAAMDSVREAGTFSCTEISESWYQDGQEYGTYLKKQKLMFKEPDWERHEQLTAAPPWPEDVGKVTIWHYDKRQRLQFRPFDKTAEFHDTSSDYFIDEKTGELKLTQLDTCIRDGMLKLSAGAVEDLGSVELDGQSVRLLRSRKDKCIATLWVNPETNYPVQIELSWMDPDHTPMMYTSIQIDTELDDELFSLEPPDGYVLSVDESGGSDYKKKMMTKMKYLGLWCGLYANDNADQFPDDLEDLVTFGIITEDVLNKVLAAPDDPDGPPMIRNRKPNMVVKDRSTEVILYEIYDQWPEDGVVACFADGHCERILDQNRFEELIK